MDCSRCGLPVPDRRTGDWKRPDVHEPPEDCLEYLKQEVRRLGSHEAEALLRMKRAEEEAVGLRAWVAAYEAKLEQLTAENQRLKGPLSEESVDVKRCKRCGLAIDPLSGDEDRHPIGSCVVQLVGKVDQLNALRERIVRALARNACTCGSGEYVNPQEHSVMCDYLAWHHDIIEMPERGK